MMNLKEGDRRHYGATMSAIDGNAGASGRGIIAMGAGTTMNGIVVGAGTLGSGFPAMPVP